MVSLLLKLLGSTIVIASTTAIGFTYAGSCAQRPVLLRNLQGMLQMFETEVAYMSSTVREAFLKIAGNKKEPVYEIFRETASGLSRQSGITAGEAWEAALKLYRRKLPFDDEDMSILADFGKCLGNTDTEGQIRNIRLTLAQLKRQEDKAEEKKHKNAGLYRNLGFLLGLVIVILLL